jgi:hypothetical protein
LLTERSVLPCKRPPPQLVQCRRPRDRRHQSQRPCACPRSRCCPRARASAACPASPGHAVIRAISLEPCPAAAATVGPAVWQPACDATCSSGHSTASAPACATSSARTVRRSRNPQYEQASATCSKCQSLCDSAASGSTCYTHQARGSRHHCAAGKGLISLHWADEARQC